MLGTLTATLQTDKSLHASRRRSEGHACDAPSRLRLAALATRARRRCRRRRRRRRSRRPVAAGVDAVLAATPYMGWDTYFALPRRRSRETTILQEADRAQDDRPRGRRLPADLARRRLVAGPARRRRQHRRQPDPVAARHRLARRDAARERLQARRLHRRRRDRLRRQGRHVRPLPAGHQHVRLVGRRRGQGRLVRRRRRRASTRRRSTAQIHQAILNDTPATARCC